MYRYHCLNPISQVGLETFTEEYVPVRTGKSRCHSRQKHEYERDGVC